MRKSRSLRRRLIVRCVAGGVFVGMAAFGLAETMVGASAAMTGTSHAMAAAGTSAAQNAVPGVPAPFVALVNRLSGGKEQVIGTLPGPDGLTGVEVEGKKGTRLAGARTLFWMLPGDKYVSFGPMFNMRGQNVTRMVMAKAGLLPHNQTKLADWKTGSPQRTVIEAMISGKGYSGFTQGHGPNRITAFIDPNCFYCHKWWESLHATKGWQQRFTIRWIPVGFLKPSSNGKAASLLAGGVSALSKDERHFDVKSESGAIAQSKDTTLIAEAKANTKRWEQALRKLHMMIGTPTLVSGGGGVFAGVRSLTSFERHKAPS